MARGRKTKEVKTTTELLTELEEQIVTTEETLKSLKAKRKELQAQLDKEKVDKLLAVIADNNMSIDDATQYIDQLKTDKTETA